MTMLSREERELILNGYKTPRNTQMHVEVEALCKHADEADKVIEGLVGALTIIMPMAKGYAVEHPVGNNAGMVESAQVALAAAGRK